MTENSCPKCNSVMATRRTRAFSEHGGSHIYYFLDCSRCGFGPTIAFNSEEEAVVHWREYILNYKPMEEAVAEETNEQISGTGEGVEATPGLLEGRLPAFAEAV